MQENNTELSVSTQVLEKMATIAACEIEGVTGLSKKAIDIKGTYEDAYVDLPEDVSTIYYDYDYKAQFEELASEIIKEAYGFTFESDGTDF